MSGNMINLKPKILLEAEELAKEIIETSDGRSYSAVAIALAKAFKSLIECCEFKYGQDSELPTNQVKVFHTFYKIALKELDIDYECLDEEEEE